MVRRSLPDLTTKHERVLYAGLIKASKLARQIAKEIQFHHFPLAEQHILDIHKAIFQRTFPAIAGQYRLGSLEPFEDGHLPPPTEQIRELMHNFVLDVSEQVKDLQPVHKGIQSTTISTLTPLIERIIEVSAYAHWKLVWIHPFTDGNGRTARVVGNLMLECYSLRPISIFVSDKESYLTALHEANRFNLAPLKTLIARLEYEELEKHGLPWVIK